MAVSKAKQQTFDIDPETGIVTVRDMTDAEQAAFDADLAALQTK